MKRFYLFLFCVFLTNFVTAQLSLNTINTAHIITFDATMPGVNNGVFTSSASGVSNTPSAGQIDTDAWAINGFSAGDVNFGGSSSATDYRRGTSNGGVTTGGLYAFDVDNTVGIDRALGFQATTSDITYGGVRLNIQNNTGSTITSVDISYEVHDFNDKSNSMIVMFSHSKDNLVYNDIPTLDFETPNTNGGSSWTVNTKSITINNLNIKAGESYYLRWNFQEDGTGSRDEFALDDISVTPHTSACTLSAEPTTSASNLTARYITCDGANIDWVNGDGTDRIVVISTTPIAGTPVDQTSYKSIPFYGQTTTITSGEYVVYNGSNSSFNLAGLNSSTTYYVAIFEYNGNACGENYLSTSTTTSFTTTTCSICPQITSVMVNGCNNGTCTNEGEGEYVILRNGDHYLPIRRNEELLTTNLFYYGNSANPMTTFTDVYTVNNILINDLNTAAGCNIFIDAFSVDVIPINANMMIIKDYFCADAYDFSNWCGNNIYVFISADRSWSTGGSFKNYNATSQIRYFRTDFSALVLDGTCTNTDYAYDVSLLSGHADGDYVNFDISQNASYGSSCMPNISPLPITLLKFNAISDGENVTCYWTTVSETNNDYFTVERSRDGLLFEEIGQIDGAGNSTTYIDYSFIDTRPHQGVSYYRLKQTDYDGKISYSSIKSVNLASNNFEILQFSANNGQKSYSVNSTYYPVSIDVYDLSGKVIKHQIISNPNDYFYLNNFTKGMYIISANNYYNSIRLKIIN
jgi:hypothetical protein